MNSILILCWKSLLFISILFFSDLIVMMNSADWIESLMLSHTWKFWSITPFLSKENSYYLWKKARWFLTLSDMKAKGSNELYAEDVIHEQQDIQQLEDDLFLKNNVME